jgi:hypothetical protein
MNARYGIGTVLVALAVVFSAHGCGGVVTSFHLTVTTTGSSPINQLYVAGETDAGIQAFMPAVRPEKADAGLLRTSESVRVLLPDTLAGKRVFLRVVGLHDTTPVSLGTANAAVVKGQEIEVPVSLSPMPCPTGTRQNADTKLCICDKTTCANGCCKVNDAREAYCLNTPVAYCETDRCETTKGCSCGFGQCKAGQHCEGGACKCDEKLCDGCCSSLGNCVPRTGADGQSLLMCGGGGAKCEACGPTGGPCAMNGTCSGVSVSCPNTNGVTTHCKSGTHCEPLAFPRCGDDRTCVWCHPLRADRCDVRGQCVCGVNTTACVPSGGVEQVCNAGRCVPTP